MAGSGSSNDYRLWTFFPSSSQSFIHPVLESRRRRFLPSFGTHHLQLTNHLSRFASIQEIYSDSALSSRHTAYWPSILGVIYDNFVCTSIIYRPGVDLLRQQYPRNQSLGFAEIPLFNFRFVQQPYATHFQLILITTFGVFSHVHPRSHRIISRLITSAPKNHCKSRSGEGPGYLLTPILICSLHHDHQRR